MFDYLGVLISVILGLALTHVLMGVSRMIQSRHSARIYWVQLVWVVTVLIFVLAIWFGMYWWRQVTVWTIQDFLFLAGYASVLFLLSSILFPAESCEGVDFEALFFRNKNWFFGLLLLSLALDIPETVTKQIAGLRPVPVQYWVFMPTVVGLAIAGIVTRNRRWHAVIALCWLASLVGYLTLSAIDRIAAH